MRRVKNVKRRRRKVRGNHGKKIKSQILQQQAQGAFLFFFRFSSHTLICLAKQPVTSLLSFRRKESHRVDDGSFDGLYGLSKYPATNRLQKSVCVSFLSLLSCFVTRPAGLSFADVLCLVRLSYLCPSILPSLVFLSYSVPHSVLFSSLPLSFGLTVEGLCRLRAFRLT